MNSTAIPRDAEMKALLKKYDIPSPRYTSYPTVPYWSDKPSAEAWQSSVRIAYDSNKGEGISLYIHLPYCESLCTYCGCNKRITINHKVERPYVDALLKEWTLYKEVLGTGIAVNEIHLGGGTPTFFSADNLGRLLDGILKDCNVMQGHAFSFEAHPANTTPEHLKSLRQRGFERLSLGIQDFDPYIQEIINRKQTYEQVGEVVREARRTGYTSINFDLIFGLPFQTPDSISKSIGMALDMMPERIAFYSYAHVPWKHRGQRRYDENGLPSDAEKRLLYETGRLMFLENGYEEIGMDHFALKGDELLKAMLAGRLHRNFMGYTPRKTSLLIGLGSSAISDSSAILIQNKKTVESYLETVNNGEIPFFRGHVLSAEDQIIRRHILALMTSYATEWPRFSDEDILLQEGITRLESCIEDGLAEVDCNAIRVTEKGRPFVRIICMALDARLHNRKKTDEPQFSKSI
jgi:oxygen-independent coproporphyrinogen-3 oxidase